MLKVLITDDEMQVRMGLRMKINWEEEGFEIVGEASNGKEAIEWLRTETINLVITDMRMPIMDGLELAQYCYTEFPQIKLIVLSGYSDYEYIRGSMKEGVKDYLLKPVSPDELEETLRKIRKEIEDEKKKQADEAQMRHFVMTQVEVIQEQYLLHLIKESWFESEMVKERLCQLQLEEMTSENTRFQIFSVEIRDKSNQSNRLRELWFPFQMICKEIAIGEKGLYTIYDPSYTNMIHFLKIVDREQGTVISLVKEIQSQVKGLLALETVIGVGSVVDGLSNLGNAYISSLLAWSKSQLVPRSQVIDVSDLQEDEFEFSADMERKLTNAVENANFIRFKENLDKLLGNNKDQSILSFSFMSNRVLFLLAASARKYNLQSKEIQNIMWNCQQSIWELNSYYKVIDQLIDLSRLIIEKVRTVRFSNGNLIIEGVRQYLDQHYANEISLTFLSEMFHINSTHLSETFKKQVGQNFSDYLVKIRMEKAKELLKDKQLKIIDVANLVGYTNSGYFSTVFKKHFKQTPAYYRQSIEEKIGRR